MPWSIEEGHSSCPVSRPFAVVKEADGHVEGCHPTAGAARRQQAALYAQEGGAMEQRAEVSAASINDLPDSAFAYIESGGKKDDSGKTTPRSLRHFPIHDAAHVRNALARAPQSPFGAKAMPAIKRAARRFGIKVAEERSQDDDQPTAPVELREAAVTEVKFPQRTITVVAVPYDEAALVEYRGELWEESFERGAFDGIEKRPNRVRANRDHDKRRTIGKAVNFWPSRQEGLVAEIRVAQTPLGDETLALADEDVLGASVGFAARGRDQVFDRGARSRRIKRAFLDHLAFTSDPAYVGAVPLDVRDRESLAIAADLPPLVTPALDEVRAWMQARQTR